MHWSDQVIRYLGVKLTVLADVAILQNVVFEVNSVQLVDHTKYVTECDFEPPQTEKD